MAITRSQLLKELLPGLNATFGMQYKSYDHEYRELFEIEKSERSFEEEVKLSGFNAAPTKTEGAAITYDNAQEAYTSRYQHETVSMGFALTEEAVEDNLYDALGMRYTKALARAMAYTKEVKGAAVFNTGFSQTALGGDGSSLFGINGAGTRVGHQLVTGGANFNSPPVGVDLNETSIEAATIQIAGWTDERGLLIAARPRKIVIPTAYMFTIKRILGSELRVGTADNDLNAIKTLNTVPDGYCVNHYLTDPNAWFILTDCPNGTKMFQRIKLTTSSEGDFDTGNMRYKARERYSFGYSDPLGVWGSSGSF